MHHKGDTADLHEDEGVENYGIRFPEVIIMVVLVLAVRLRVHSTRKLTSLL